MLKTRNILTILTLVSLMIDPSLAGAGAAEPATPPPLTIVPAYEGIAAYADAVRADANADPVALYREKVMGPHFSQCIGNGEYFWLAQMAMDKPPKDLDGIMKVAATLAKSNPRPEIEAAFQKITKLLPGPATTVCIFAADPDLAPVMRGMDGVAGLTVGAGKIWLQILPEGDWQQWLAYNLAHEHHHSVWTRSHFDRSKRQTLLGYLVFEGKADAFATMVYPKRRAPWTNALTPAQESAQWKAMRPHLDDTSNAVMAKFMFGDEKEIPRSAGYTIGFRIVQSFLKRHPEVSVEQWTALDAHELLEQSSYDPGS